MHEGIPSLVGVCKGGVPSSLVCIRVVTSGGSVGISGICFLYVLRLFIPDFGGQWCLSKAQVYFVNAFLPILAHA